MKKLLTVLLTFVMAICLINLNNSQTKAEETNGTTYTYTWNGSTWIKPDPEPATFNDGDMINIANSTGTQIKTLVNGSAESTEGTCTTGFGISHNGATIILTPGETNYKAIITDVDANVPVPCVGISFDGTDWKLGNTVINSTQLKNTFGITYTAGNPAKVTLKKSLKLTETAVLLWLKANIDIELENNVTLDNGGKSGLTLKLGGEHTPINARLYGKGHTLSLISSNNQKNFILDDNSTLNLYNVKIDATSSYVNDTYVVRSSGYIKFDDKSELHAKCTSNANTSYAMSSPYDPTFVGDYEILGTADGTKNDLKVATRNTFANYEYKVDVSGTLTNAKYIVIRPKLEKNPCTKEACNITTEKDKDVTAYITDKNYDTVEATAKVKLNGNELTRGTQFELSPGSVYVTMKKEYLSGLTAGTYDFVATLGSDDYHIHVTINDSSPTPSPSKKDESCEKVIGPSWHWNNSKGICEDYGVVGTYTR